MICHPCRTPDHSGCPGGTWCDCQHEGAVAAPLVLDRDARAALAVEQLNPPNVISINSNGDRNGA